MGYTLEKSTGGGDHYIAKIDGKTIGESEGDAEIHFKKCSFHGEQYHIRLENQGGYDCTILCLKCAKDIYDVVQEQNALYGYNLGKGKKK